MKENTLITTFQDAGLSENEAHIYFASLSLGPSTVQQIARAAEVKRTTTYDVIESLQHKGLMRIELEGFKRKFVAESPEKLERLLEQRQVEFKSHIPEMLSLFNLQGGEGFIKYYEGKEALKNVYESMIQDIKPGQDYLILSRGLPVYEMYGKWFDDFSERRGKLDINIRILLQKDPSADTYKKREKQWNFKTKFLPTETELTTNLVVTPQRVFIHQLTSPIIGIVIENKSVIQMHQETFEILWKAL